MSLCFAFCQSFNPGQSQRYATLLWDEKHLNAQTNFPQTDIFLNSVFLDMPAPSGIDTAELFKKYSLENIKDTDIFGNIAGSAQAAGEKSFAMTNGWSWMAIEWESGFGIFTDKSIELNTDETQILYDYIRSYWEKHKHHLNESSSPFFSITDEFNSRFQTLLRVLAVVVIPNAIKNNTETIMGNIDQFLMEMDNSRLNIGLVKVVSLAFFPDQQKDIQILLIMKHKRIAFELDTQ